MYFKVKIPSTTNNCHILITGGDSFPIAAHYSLKVLNTIRVHFHVARTPQALDLTEPLIYPTIILNDTTKTFTLLCPHVNKTFMEKKQLRLDESLEKQCSELVFKDGAFNVLIG